MFLVQYLPVVVSLSLRSPCITCAWKDAFIYRTNKLFKVVRASRLCCDQATHALATGVANLRHVAAKL